MLERIQHKGTKGWRMPPNTVYVGRGSRWDNPYKIGTTMLKPEDLPPPETLIDYGGGTFGPLMFHFAGEDDNASDIARGKGFEYYWVEFNDVVPDDHSLSIAYANGADPADILPHWVPPEPKPGFFLAGKNDSENGLVAHYLKKCN